MAINYDQLAADYARHRQIHPQVFRALAEAVIPSSRVLEVGCGTGNYILALQAATGCACWGIDPSREMLSVARGRPGEVSFRLGCAEQFDPSLASFDLIFSVDVIHHVADHAAYYHNAHRALSPAGRICTATDSEWVIRHRQPLSTYFPETVEPELARYPRIDVLYDTMAKAGFDEIAAHTVEWSYDLTDIQTYRDKVYSALHLIPEEAFQRGVAHLSRDLSRGPIPCTSRYTLLWGSKQT